MTDLLLDTHVALWLDSGDDRLGAATRRAIDGAWKAGGRILLSAVSVWEIAVLVDKGFIELDVPVEAWVARFLSRPGLAAVPLDHETAARAYQLHHLEHRDPADRLLIASAIGLDCPLVTHDDRIRRFARSRGRQYGFTIA
ncbi:MAG: type II toxin-antitoxin system VapC family toxin [Proteobacteria bacterium]|nr:type II toxin-antitoxin system VapC family toxin [Pseudomonadota bacterium]